jgi:hypothetical protein
MYRAVPLSLGRASFRLGDARDGLVIGKKNILSVLGVEPLLFGLVVFSLVMMLTELSRLGVFI